STWFRSEETLSATQVAGEGCELLLFMLTEPAFCECNHAWGGTPSAYSPGILRDGAGACISTRLHSTARTDRAGMSSAVKKAVDLKSASQQTERTAGEPDPVVNRFLEAVWMELGLSVNTLAAYRADLTALNRWLERKDIPIIKTARNDLLGFIAWRVEAGARPRSTARQLSSFRRFFRYLAREGMIREDPTAQIAMPKIGRSLPKS